VHEWSRPGRGALLKLGQDQTGAAFSEHISFPDISALLDATSILMIIITAHSVRSISSACPTGIWFSGSDWQIASID
jgi:hypothetical protein